MSLAPSIGGVVICTLTHPSLGARHADMDGTLTANVIDFAAMRRRAGVHPVHGDILDEVAKMSPERQARAKAAIKDVELQARNIHPLVSV